MAMEAPRCRTMHVGYEYLGHLMSTIFEPFLRLELELSKRPFGTVNHWEEVCINHGRLTGILGFKAHTTGTNRP